MKQSVEARLKAKVVEADSGCWVWTGAVDRHGHGQVWFEDRPVSAHRVAYSVWVGPIPEKHEVRRKCGNSLCINPTHLVERERKEAA